jgi:hypothetical protein
MQRLGWVVVIGCVGCFTDAKAKHGYYTPAWDMKNVSNYAETVKGGDPETAYGWDLRIAGGVARWRECASAEECGEIERERPASEVLAFERVGIVHDTDVLKLSLAPRRKYIVPR